MTSQCNGLCDRIKTIPPYGEDKYANGRKYCRCCSCYIVTEKNRCECCRMSIRSKPREKKVIT